jgi:hypothetical protein
MPTETVRDPVRAASNRLFLKISGRRLRAYSIVKHVGRRSGCEYANPVSAYPLGDGFVITILYGLDSQWVRNVLATGRLTLVTQGRQHALERPELIHDPGTARLPPLAAAHAQDPRRRALLLGTRARSWRPAHPGLTLRRHTRGSAGVAVEDHSLGM